MLNVKKYLNWYTVSKTLCGHPRTLSANRIPKKHEKAVNELLNAVREWHDKYVKENCNLQNVMPRFSAKQLHISRGARTLNIKGFIDVTKKPTATVTCIEQWDNDGTGLYEESDDNQWATFYLRAEDIDPIISKLLEIKGFLNGA